MSRFTVSRYAIDERGKAKHPTNSDRKSGSALIEIKSAHVSMGSVPRHRHTVKCYCICSLLNTSNEQLCNSEVSTAQCRTVGLRLGQIR
jgi:hypothetical protein